MNNLSSGKWVRLAVIIAMLTASLSTVALAADNSIVGEVNDNYQIVSADGQIYEIADTPEGNDLAENHIGEKVKVTGALEERDDMKIITVTSYQVISE